MAFHQTCQQMFSMMMKLLPITNFLFYFQLVMYETAAFHDKLTPLFIFEKSGSGPLIKEISQCIEHCRIPVALHDFHPSCSNTMHYNPEIVGIHLFLSRVAQQLASFIKQALIVLEYGINPCRLEGKEPSMLRQTCHLLQLNAQCHSISQKNFIHTARHRGL